MKVRLPACLPLKDLLIELQQWVRDINMLRNLQFMFVLTRSSVNDAWQLLIACGASLAWAHAIQP